MNRNRYNHRDRPTRQELAAARETARIPAELAAHGHDEAAAERARRIDQAQRTITDVIPGFPEEFQARATEKMNQEIAEIRASGPVGCTCTYWRCVESRPNVT